MFGIKKQPMQVDCKLYLIYDSLLGVYERPNFAISDDDLKRQMINLFMDPSQAQNKYFLNSEHYSAYCVGQLEFKTGRFEAHEPTHAASFHELKAQALIQSSKNILRDMEQHKVHLSTSGINPT